MEGQIEHKQDWIWEKCQISLHVWDLTDTLWVYAIWDWATNTILHSLIFIQYLTLSAKDERKEQYWLGGAVQYMNV